MRFLTNGWFHHMSQRGEKKGQPHHHHHHHRLGLAEVVSNGHDVLPFEKYTSKYALEKYTR